MNNNKLSVITKVTYVITNNHLDTDDLVSMLEITPEDLMERFEDRMYEFREKFLLEESYDQLGEEELGEETTGWEEEAFGPGSEGSED